MLAALATGAGHPAVAALLGLGAAGLAGVVVAMAWNVHVRQIRLAEHLVRRQFIATPDADTAGPEMNGNGSHEAVPRKTEVAVGAARAGGATRAAGAAGTAGGGTASPVVIDGPETVITGEQTRYRVRPAGSSTAVSWAVGGGSVSQSPDPSHPDELLLIADRPGDLTIIARVREGMAERRATKPITALPEMTVPMPPVMLRLFLNGWGLVAVAMLIVGFAGALDVLGRFASSDFIALAALLAALLGVVAVARGTADGADRPRRRKG